MLVLKGDVAWALERILDHTPWDVETRIILCDCGVEFKKRYSEVYDRYQIKREFRAPTTPRPYGRAERDLAILGVPELAARVRAGSLVT